MRVNKNFFYCIIAFAAGVLLSSGSLLLAAEPSAVEELRITQSSAAIGALNESVTDQQVYSYDFVLYNGRGEAVNVSFVEPVFGENVSDRVITKDTAISVNETVSSGSSIVIEGKIVFDASGLTKEETLGLEPFIDHVIIVSTDAIDYP